MIYAYKHTYIYILYSYFYILWKVKNYWFKISKCLFYKKNKIALYNLRDYSIYLSNKDLNISITRIPINIIEYVHDVLLFNHPGAFTNIKYLFK